MGNHRLETSRRGRRVQPRGRTPVRPRVRRILAAAVSAMVTVVALLGAVGFIPLGGAGADATRSLATNVADSVTGSGTPQPSASSTARTTESAPASPRTQESSAKTPATTSGKVTTKSGTGTAKGGTSARKAVVALPDGSGSGRRVVFSMHDQRVWLVNAKGLTAATYLVSGSVTDNLSPGSYEVYSRSRWAVGIDDSGVMEFFVRFTRGQNAPIGFHSIPTKHGTPLQTVEQLGTPQSHGCIRQRRSDAERMWHFAGTGTPVVVVA